MADIKGDGYRSVTAAVAVLLVCVWLAACGGASKSSSSSTGAATTGGGSGTTSTSTGAGGSGGGFAALRECLQREGITQPGGTGLRLRKGVSSAEVQAAIKTCGGTAPSGATESPAGPTLTRQLTKWADCIRRAGVNLPPLNTSGNGPLLDTKGVDTSSPQFRAAEAKCRRYLRGAF